ncbi:MAG: D-cysteine desulfhydrase family protein [Candidatus Zixiibacteriota bacterium]|nr:MAG: D-cysteine desulfhydrase family protein [candidate division Zixibacteria bacterium]
MKINPPARFSLAQLPTPLEVLPLSPSPKSGIDIFIKRDDLTGSILSGNKIRKLEFLFYDLVSKKSDIVITCGGVQSNHCRAVAALCAMSGIECHLVLKGKKPGIPDGNYFLDKLFGAKTTFVTVREYEKDINGIMHKIANRYKGRKKRPYVITEGGTDPLGIWGYVKALEEIKKQVTRAKIKIDTICCAVGSGGTYAGLYLGSKMARWNINVYGVAVARNKRYYEKVIFDNCIAFEKGIGKNLGIDPLEFDIDDNHIGPGYGKIGPAETDFIRNVARYTGIVLDPAYTSKALLGLFSSIAGGKYKKGSNILFIHTGGQWGLLPSRGKFSGK